MPTPTQVLQQQLDQFTPEQIQEAIDLETPSEQENIDWLKYLQNQASGTPAKGTLFGGKYSFLWIGAIVFVGVLIVYNVINKK